MICANDIDRKNWFNIKSDMPHVVRAHESVMSAMSHLIVADPLYSQLGAVEIELQQRIAGYDDELKAIKARADEHRKAVTA